MFLPFTFRRGISIILFTDLCKCTYHNYVMWVIREIFLKENLMFFLNLQSHGRKE
jgi:hypothetical protein